MAKVTLSEALDAVELTYQELNQIANDITQEFFNPINEVIDRLRLNINALTNDSIREYMITLSVSSYSLSEIKEKSALKAECAEALRKEAVARNYAVAEGTSAAKDYMANLNASSEIVSEALYNLVANLFKTKLDEIHRVVDTLKSVLMSRLSEAKLTNNIID